MGTDTIRQHYVPCCYLENFGRNGNKGRKTEIYSLNLQSQKICIGSVEAYAYENRFYDIESDLFPQQLLESFFVDVEGEYASLLRQFIALAESEVLPIKTKEELAAQFSFQYIRTREYRNNYREILRELCNHFPQIASRFSTSKEIKDYIQQVHNSEILGFQSANYYANLFFFRKWMILVNKSTIPFVTSDNPVCMIYHSSEYYPAITSPKTKTFIPITPTLAILMVDSSLGDWSDRDVLALAGEEFVRAFNRHVLENATRFVFANNENLLQYL